MAIGPWGTRDELGRLSHFLTTGAFRLRIDTSASVSLELVPRQSQSMPTAGSEPIVWPGRAIKLAREARASIA